MLYAGQAITVGEIADGLYRLRFDARGERVNKFNRATLDELAAALEALATTDEVRGLLIDSAKRGFIVGADINEFLPLFAQSQARIAAAIGAVNTLFGRLSQLPFATVAAVDGEALGGGFEICLACDFRVLSQRAVVGLPETKLGIIPGWGGTVRLPRLIGVDNAIEWIAGADSQRAEAALAVGAVDAVVSSEDVEAAALDLLRQAAEGDQDVAARRARQAAPLALPAIERAMAFESARALVAAKAGRHYPAPLSAIEVIEAGASEGVDAALAIESAHFARLAQSATARSLVGIFLKDRVIKKAAARAAGEAPPVARAAVLGAGIMGGGIAYQSAATGTPIVMKDISDEALAAGLAEAGKRVGGQLARGRLDQAGAMRVLNAIVPVRSYGEFGAVELVVEAVTENRAIKAAVLAEAEAAVGEDAVIASNTSTIRIGELAAALQRPANFCGLHFFNPVHRMPLVEVIRGEHSSARTIERTVRYARQLGKTPIVVEDCPGFLVNRILFPYFAGFESLLADGVDFARIDAVMERFGWPMGPAYLLDVVGLDTAEHAGAVLAAGYPERMARAPDTAVAALVGAGRLGQKSGAGFYCYRADKRGKLQKFPDPAVRECLGARGDGRTELDEAAIVARMMVPLCTEAARCLEDGIVADAAAVDMGLVYGLGFPPFRGGALQYIDDGGAAAFVELADGLAERGALFAPTAAQRQMAADGARYYPTGR